MSGPKVIRIVTREEIIAICRGMLARLDAAIASWRKTGERNGTVTAADIAATEMRREVMRALLAKDRFRDLQTKVAEEIAYLKRDTQERIARAAAAAAEAALAAQRTANTARSILQALDKEGKPVPAELRRRLLAASAGGNGADASIKEAFRLLAPQPSPTKASEKQRDLAKALGAGAIPLTLEAWLGAHEGTDTQGADRVEREIAELEVRAGPKLTDFFAGRIRAFREESSPTRRQMLADSLLVELASATQREKARHATIEDLVAMRAELDLLTSASARGLCDAIDAELATPGTSAATGLVTRAADLIAQEMRERAVASRRLAVLQGLASLGYEVAEGMATAWVKDGKVVLRRAASPGYGVEIFGGGSEERLQVRPVRLGASDTTRDRDIETIWCDEFDRLRRLVAKSGGEIAIEKATPIGVTPLKTIERYHDYVAEVARRPPRRALHAR